METDGENICKLTCVPLRPGGPGGHSTHVDSRGSGGAEVGDGMGRAVTKAFGCTDGQFQNNNTINVHPPTYVVDD